MLKPHKHFDYLFHLVNVLLRRFHLPSIFVFSATYVFGCQCEKSTQSIKQKQCSGECVSVCAVWPLAYGQIWSGCFRIWFDWMGWCACAFLSLYLQPLVVDAFIELKLDFILSVIHAPKRMVDTLIRFLWSKYCCFGPKRAHINIESVAVGMACSFTWLFYHTKSYFTSY